MSTFQAQMTSQTGTLEVGSGTINGIAPITVTEEEALYLRANYAGVTVNELQDEAQKPE